jgi:hypothetical protein
MPGLTRKSSAVWTVGLILLAFGIGGCNHRAANHPPSENASEDGAVVQQQQGASGVSPNSEAAGQAAAALGYQTTPINPTRTAYLMAQSEGAQINVRSQPTTQSESLGFGISGHEVTLLRLAEGEGGYSWYFLKVVDTQTEGWIRGDFIDTRGETVAAAQESEPDTSEAQAEELPDDQGACGRDRQEAYFETDTFTIHICNTGNGLRYVGLNKENQESLVTEDVRARQGTYVAIDGNYQYHINNNTLAVYQVNQGDYQPLANETVTRHERFIY